MIPLRTAQFYDISNVQREIVCVCVCVFYLSHVPMKLVTVSTKLV